jgi:hypothetical protein
MASDPTDESDIRNAALEEAAEAASAEIRRLHKVLMPVYEGKVAEPNLAIADALSAAIRALKSDPALVPASKPSLEEER